MPRLSDKERLVAIEERKKALDIEAARIRNRQKQEDRKAETRRKIILGGAIIAVLESQPEKRDMLRGLIEPVVQRDKDREAIAAVFSGPPAA